MDVSALFRDLELGLSQRIFWCAELVARECQDPHCGWPDVDCGNSRAALNTMQIITRIEDNIKSQFDICFHRGTESR